MKNYFKILFLLTSIIVQSQVKSQWNGYFSFNAIKDISMGSQSVFAATENAYFTKNTVSKIEKTITTVEGLSGENITQIHYSKEYNKTILGHTDGLIIVINEVDGSMLYVVDIINKGSIPPNKKRINHFCEYKGKIYISSDFGISVFNLKTSQFGDTYYIGPNGSNIEIFQTTVLNDVIYAAANGYGILRASVNNPFIVDFSQWTMVSADNWSAVDKIGTKIIATNLNGGLYAFNGDTPVLIRYLPQLTNDVRSVDNKLILTAQNYVTFLDDLFTQTLQINNIPNNAATFTCATVINNEIYIGTKENGIFTTNFNNPTTFKNFTPPGPVRNKIFGLSSFRSGFWMVYGDHSGYYNPYPLDEFPITKYSSDTNLYKSTAYADIFSAKSITKNLVNPNNENQVFFGSSYSGLLKVESDVPTTIYNSSNSTLSTIPGEVPDDIRVNALSFDNEGNLWVTNAITPVGLHSFKNNGQWQAYNLSCATGQRFSSYGTIAVDKNGTKWITTNNNGVIAFNEKYNNKCLAIIEGEGEGNLPSIDARAVAVDQKNKLWIGTTKGLRIVNSVDSFLSQNAIESTSIIILEDNLAQELMFNQFITDIVVDGANNKWISTAGAGVFYLSADGQKTFAIFTKENSPLPSNTIIDLEINKFTGEVFMATENGLVSFKGNATAGSDNLQNVIVYPNPVRPGFTGYVAITGLTDKANVKITDIESNLVFEAISQGGTLMWDTTNFRKRKVASGVYMLHLSTSDGLETEVKKVMIVR